eukprot:CAMPEP_0181242602 /NCGR_PEP_ID=MMETSP1096-20121128/41783_1 /TAXON_ID=156174 ORGANISM="Chrysochromulina ericina, Strain CCMP281" /NCGR_SAMPLE_ID=MMETSP1096 /ASSEMBLY_ACC=CAM_ASM_000453 /LENGTH=61 /DNA_ID=CAMNT_0023338833 /DNA_START=70 /DNA_END=255 /DNA_ORIENTATION=+
MKAGRAPPGLDRYDISKARLCELASARSRMQDWSTSTRCRTSCTKATTIIPAAFDISASSS